MAEKGHKNDWETLIGFMEFVKTLPTLLHKDSILVDKEEEVNAIFFDDGVQSTETVFTISEKDDLSPLVFLVENKVRHANEIVCFYPFVRGGKKVRLQITEIKEWENKYEAIIYATNGEVTISFFDTKYFKNKEKYKIGNEYTFYLNALAYNVHFLPEDKKRVSHEGQDAARWYAMMGQEPEYDEKGKIKPYIMDFSKTVAYLPRHEDFYDDAQIQAPIISVEKISAFQTEFYKFKIKIWQNPNLDPDFCSPNIPDIYVDLYTKVDFFERTPTTEDSLEGFIWLQGYLEE